MTAYRASLSIRERLAGAEPGRADYQRDLSVSHSKLGDLYVALGRGEDAMTAYQASLSIAERLAGAEPGRADYQRDLSVSHSKLGDLYVALGRGEDAMTAYERFLQFATATWTMAPEIVDHVVDLARALVATASFHDDDASRRLSAAHSLLESLGEQRLPAHGREMLSTLRQMSTEADPPSPP